MRALLRTLAVAVALATGALAAAAAPARAQGGLVVTPTPLDFATVAVGQTATKPLSVANTDAMATVVVSSISKPATTACDAFTIAPAPALPDTIPASTTRTWSVAFKPTTATAYDCSVAVNDNDGKNDVIHVVGSGGVATLGAVPSPVAFGPVVVGTTADQTITIKNSGTVELQLGAIAQPAAPFSLTGAPAAGTVVPPGGSLMFVAHYAPAALGTAQATVSIPSNDPASPYALPLSGSGATAGGAVIALSPSPVMFGATPVGAAVGASLAIGDTGTMSLQVTALAITGANAADFTFADAALGCTAGQTCAAPFTVAPSGTARTVALSCKPSTFGSRLATLTITSNASSGPSTVTLNCTGNAPAVRATPTSVDFGTVRVNTQAPAQLSIANVGNVDLHVASIALTGANAGDFDETGCALGCTIRPGASIAVALAFTPPARGKRAANLEVHSDDPAAPVYVVPLAGAGGAGVLAITQPAGGAIDFGNIPVAATSSPAPITIQNQGELSLTIGSITTSPAQFARGGPAAPLTLAAGASATWQLTCTPTTVSTYTGATTFTSDALVNPTQSVALACTGATGSLIGTPAPVSFGAVRTDRTKTTTIVVKNVGGAPVTVQAASLVDAAGVFRVEAQGALPHALGSGQTMSFDVTFAPTAQQTFTGKLVLTDANAATALTVNLNGDGQVAAYAVAPGSDDFGSLCVGQSASRDVTVSNTGSATVRLSSTTIRGDAFTIASGAAGNGVDLAAGQVRTVTIVGVAPAGAATGALTVTTDLATGGTTEVPLSIAGVGDSVAANPSSIDFGEQPLEVAGAPQQVMVVNCARAPLAIETVAITGETTAFAEQGPAAITLPVGASQAWSVTFTAHHEGGHAGALVLTTDAQTITVPLAGTGATAGTGGDAGTGNGETSNSYYGCGCHADGGDVAGAGAPILLAVALIGRRRRRA